MNETNETANENAATDAAATTETEPTTEAATAETAEAEAGIVGVCADCGHEIREGDAYITDHEGRLVCADCTSDYEKCCECGEWFKADEEVYAHRSDDGEALCELCYEANYSTCENCDAVVHNSDTYITAGGELICQSCYDDEYFTCPRCDDVYRWSDGEDVGDERYCESCARELQEEEDEENGVMDYHDFCDCCYKPRVCEGESPSGGVYMGVELEVDNGDFCCDDFADWVNSRDLIHFEHDGSLSRNGVECITMPCSLRFHQERMKWPELCAAFRGQDFLSHDSDGHTCGLHIHLSRQPLSKPTLVKMDIWINRWQIWRDVARRRSIYSGRYDDAKSVKESICDATVDVPSSRIHKTMRKYKKEYGPRYVPLNFHTDNDGKTVEVRIFRGTLNPETILGTLEMVYAVTQFAPTVSIKEVYSERMPARFLLYIADNKAKYPHVFPMLKRLAKGEHNSAEAMEIISKNA